jgi:uncharacterized OB-fold protein
MEGGFNVAAIVDAENADYHRWLGRRELRAQCCTDCGYIRLPQRFACPQCLSEQAEWKRLSGRGTVETFVWYFKNILDRRYTQVWSYQDAPYNVAVVRLDEGPCVISNIEDTDFESLKAGLQATAHFIPISDEYAILRFGLLSKSSV